MGTATNVIGAAIGLVFTGVGTWNTIDMLMQQGTPSQPGQPSQQPQPKNPQPRPSDPVPEPKNPQPRPSDPVPDPQNPVPDPNNPGAPNQPPERQPGQEQDRDRRDATDRYLRPFAFQTPGSEGRFNLTARRLVLMEQRMQQSQEDLLKRLGEARRLSGERQTQALFEVLQQMLQEREELNRYLVQSRTAWTGDLDIADESQSPDNQAPLRREGR